MHQELYQQGIAKAEAGEWQAANELFDQVLQLRPDFSEAYFQRGRIRFKLNQFSEAIADYTRALLADSGNANLYYARSIAHLSANSFESAIADAKDSIRLKPDFAAAYHLLGTIRQKQGMKQKAIASYKKAAELYLDQQEVANCRRCLELLRQLQPAPSQPSRLSLPPPVSPQEFLQRAVEKANVKSYGGAIEDLNWAIQIDPRDVEAYVCRARIRAKFDDRWGAIEDYRQAARLYLDRAEKELAQQMLNQIEQLQSKQTRSVQSYTTQGSPRSIRYRAPSSGRINPEIQRKLLRLVGDDRRIAIGLVERLHLRHPGMPEDWYWEKAIYDLERDRR
jgi:tetratricopeptide (TPR) repeat protein